MSERRGSIIAGVTCWQWGDLDAQSGPTWYRVEPDGIELATNREVELLDSIHDTTQLLDWAAANITSMSRGDLFWTVTGPTGSYGHVALRYALEHARRSALAAR